MTDTTSVLDHEVVNGLCRKESAALAELYDRYSEGIYGFCLSILRCRDAAEDATHDTFLKAAQRIDQLRDPAKLKSWLFSIARNEAIAETRRLRRNASELPEIAIDDGRSPADRAESEEMIDLVWDASEGLDYRDREVLELSVRHGMNGEELAETLGIRRDHAYVVMHRARERVGTSLRALMVARLGRNDCRGLAAVLNGWSGRYSPAVRRDVLRHIKSCQTCSDRQRALVSPISVMAAAPIAVPAIAVRDRVLTSHVTAVEGAAGSETSSDIGLSGSEARHGNRDLNRAQRRAGSGRETRPPSTRYRPRRGFAVTSAAVVASTMALLGMLAATGATSESDADALTASLPAPAVGDPDDTIAATAAAQTPATQATTPPIAASSEDDPLGVVTLPLEAEPPAQLAAPPDQGSPRSNPGLEITPTPDLPTDETSPSVDPLVIGRDTSASTTPVTVPENNEPKPPQQQPAGPIITDVQSVDVGHDLEGEFWLINISDEAVSWSMAAASVQLSPSNGVLPAGMKIPMTVTIDPEAIDNGPFDLHARIAGGGVLLEVAVHGTPPITIPPIIVNTTTTLPAPPLVLSLISDPDPRPTEHVPASLTPEQLGRAT